MLNTLPWMICFKLKTFWADHFTTFKYIVFLVYHTKACESNKNKDQLHEQKKSVMVIFPLWPIMVFIRILLKDAHIL